MKSNSSLRNYTDLNTITTSCYPSNEYFTVNSNDTLGTINTIQFNTSNYMENNSSQPQQVQVAVFEISNWNENLLNPISTQHVSTFWIEQKPKTDLKLIIAKKLAKEVDLDKIVIKELTRISF
jgi:hypothetical protein